MDDSSYEGVLHLHVINVGDEAQKVYFDEKLVQFVPYKINEYSLKVQECCKNNANEGKFVTVGLPRLVVLCQ